MRFGDRRATRRMTRDDSWNTRAKPDPLVARHDRIAQRLGDERRGAKIRHLAADMFQYEPAFGEGVATGREFGRRRAVDGVARVRPLVGAIQAFELGEPALIDAAARPSGWLRRDFGREAAAGQAGGMADIRRVGGE